MNRPPKGTHVQGEAFLVMRYEGVGGRREWIWNSRDAITPFTVSAADDESIELQHGNWHLDRYEPWYVPPIGSRVFVDLTEELARPMAARYVDLYWERYLSVNPTLGALGRAGTVEYFIAEWVAKWGGHAPCVTTVTPALHAQFAARAANGAQTRRTS